jgi:CubicO group peptidase (beta-lactamase class C family)
LAKALTSLFMSLNWFQISDFPPEETGTKREYHGLTRGWILNEIFRRVDPEGRTIGQYLREEISGPLKADAFIG